MWTRLAIVMVASIGLLASPAFAGNERRPSSTVPPEHISILSQHDRNVRLANTPPALAHRPRIVSPHVFGTPGHATFFVVDAPVVYAPPVVYVQPTPVYVPVYVLPGGAAPVEPGDVPPPVEPAREVVYPNGRWELHGNGVTAPYVWVWTPTYRPAATTPSAEPPVPLAPPSS